MLNKTEGLLEFEQWTLRYRLPVGPGPAPLLLLIHGWTGDENVMWIFTARLSPHYFILAPRGLYPAAEGGFGWEPRQRQGWPAVDDFRPSVEALLVLLDDMKSKINGLPRDTTRTGFSSLDIMGFSQGAALAYTFILLHPERVRRLAGLAGFVPEEAETLAQNRPLLGKPIFIAHGQHDERVPVEKARKAARLFKEAGAEVTYCEEDVGHKLSAACFRQLETFFQP